MKSADIKQKRAAAKSYDAIAKRAGHMSKGGRGITPC